MRTTNTCLCGSNKEYTICCEPLHSGQAASSAEALMRSRYSAFALQLTDYLLSSWHPNTRPVHINLEADTQWRRLEIIHSSNDDLNGQVHFKAFYQEFKKGSSQWYLLEETSKFIFESGHWLYHSGDYQPQTLNPNRNDLCPCGSNKKFKKCCL